MKDLRMSYILVNATPKSKQGLQKKKDLTISQTLADGTAKT